MVWCSSIAHDGLRDGCRLPGVPFWPVALSLLCGVTGTTELHGPSMDFGPSTSEVASFERPFGIVIDMVEENKDMRGSCGDENL